MRLRVVVSFVAFITLWTTLAAAQKSSGPSNGTLIIDGGGATAPIVRRFVELAGGPQARIVVIATAPSSIRFGEDNVILDPDWPRDRKEWQQYDAFLKRWFGVDRVEIIHTRDRATADTESFVRPLNSATASAFLQTLLSIRI
jgi:cyanophycinase